MSPHTLAILTFIAAPGLAAADDSKAVLAALQAIDAEIKAEHFDLARADLDGDGDDDAFALMNGQSGYRGSGGGTLFVLRNDKGSFAKAGAIGVVNEPVYLRAAKHHGLRDLLVTVGGGGAKPGLAALAFDGKSYPASPGEAKAKRQDDDQVLFAEAVPPFRQTEKLHGISFTVTSPNRKSGNSVTVTPAGLEKDNAPITTEVNGLITRIEVADINADGSPEIYVYGFDGTSQTLLAWSSNSKKSLSQITLPELKDDAKHAKGWRGKDEFAVVEGILARRFPIYPDDKPESKPTGKTRQLQYKLHAGEAGWRFKLDKAVEF